MFEFYLQYEYWFAAAQLTLAMIGMGAALSIDHFVKVFAFPKAFISGLVLQVAATPLLAWLLIEFAGLSPGLAAGIAVIAVTPGGSLTNVLAHISGGNSALSVALTASATLLCLVTVPVLLSVMIRDVMPPDFEMPARRIALEIVAFLLTPLGVGMLIYKYMPQNRGWISTFTIRASLVVVTLIFFGALGSGRVDWSALSYTGVFVTAGFGAALMAMTLAIPLLLRIKRKDQAAIQIEIVGRNVNLGVLLMVSVFPATAQLQGGAPDPIGATAFSALLFYGGFGFAAMVLIAAAHTFLNRRVLSNGRVGIGRRQGSAERPGS